jgi:hypothetical protein
MGNATIAAEESKLLQEIASVHVGNARFKKEESRAVSE